MSAYDTQTDQTLLDIASMYDNGKLLDIAKVLHRRDQLLRILRWEEATGETIHRGSKEVYLGGGAPVRGPNQGAGVANPQSQPFTESLVHLEIRHEVDELFKKMVNDFETYRYKKDMMGLEGFRQAFFDRIMYGNLSSVVADQPNGLAARRNTLNQTAEDGTTVVVHDNGGSTSSVQTSIWVIQPGEGKFTMLYPKGGGQTVVDMKDEGREFRYTSVSDQEGLYKYVTKFEMDYGLAIYQDKAVHRIANVQTNGSSELDLDLLLWVLDLVPEYDDLSGTYILANRKGIHQIKKALRNRPNILYQSPGEFGRPVDYISGAQLVLCEGITNTESVVT